MRTTFKRILAASLLVILVPSSHAQELDLDSLVDAQEAQEADPADQYGPGDDKEFTVSTEDDITSLEKDDLYKNNGSLFKIISIASKGEEGGTFTVQRIGGTNDPNPSWVRTSGSGPPSIITRESLWDLYLAAGWTMHGIAACLFVTIILGVNGLWIYRRGKQCPSQFVEQAQTALENRDLDRLHELAHYETGLLGSICRAMVTRFESSTLQDINDRCALEAGRYVRVLRVPLNGLSLISAIAPLLGLLGTVIGIVACFDTIAYEAASASKSQALASGIRIALFTTVGGLTVAIPAQVVLFISNLRLTSIVSECEFFAEQFLHEVALIKRAEESAQVVVAAPPGVARRKRRSTGVAEPQPDAVVQPAPPPTPTVPAAPEQPPAVAPAPEAPAVAEQAPVAASGESMAEAEASAPVAAEPEPVATQPAAPTPVGESAPQPAAVQPAPVEPPAVEPAAAASTQKPARARKAKKRKKAAAKPAAKPAAGGFVSGGLVSNEEFQNQLEEVAKPAAPQPAPASEPADDEDDIEFGEWTDS